MSSGRRNRESYLKVPESKSYKRAKTVSDKTPQSTSAISEGKV